MLGLRIAAVVAPTCVLVLVLACSGSPSHPPLEDPTRDGGSHPPIDVAITDVQEDTAGQCNDMQGGQPQVDVVFVGPGNAPSPNGGTIADGVYTMATYVVYANLENGSTGKSGNWWRQAFRFKGSGFDLVTESDQAARDRKSGEWAVDQTNPTQLAFDFKCPQEAQQSFGYTAVPGKVTIFYPAPNGATAVAEYNQTQ